MAALLRLLTLGQRRAEKADCELHWSDFLDHAEGQLALVVPPDRLDDAFEATLSQDRRLRLPANVWLAAARRYGYRGTCIASVAAGRGWPRRRRARRWWRPMTCSTTAPSGGSCRMS